MDIQKIEKDRTLSGEYTTILITMKNGTIITLGDLEDDVTKNGYENLNIEITRKKKYTSNKKPSLRIVADGETLKEWD